MSAVTVGYHEVLTEGDDQLPFNVLGLAPDPIDGPEGTDATTFGIGVVSEEVSKVVIDVADLTEVEAVANGWLTAWWPRRRPFTVRGFRTDGQPITEVAES